MNSDVTQLANAMRHQPKPMSGAAPGNRSEARGKHGSTIIPMALPWPWRRWTASALGMTLMVLGIYGTARGLIWMVNWLL
jgi:hypothetical protein